MGEDEESVVCVCVSVVVWSGRGLGFRGVGWGGAQVSVADGTVVLRASICEKELEMD